MAKSTRNYLALDLGAESGRGIIGRFDGKKIALEEVYRFNHTIFQYQGTIRWDVLLMVQHLKEAIRAAVAPTKGNLASLGIDTWGVDYVLLDKAGDPLGYPFHYRDPRTDAAMPAAIAKLGKEAIFATTGLQFQLFNTLFQLYAEAQSASGRLAAAKTMLFMPDFLSYALGGDKVCEYTIASTSMMLDARKRTWAKELIAKLGIPTGILPKIVKPGTVAGQLSQDVADFTGAPTSMKIVAPGRHDTASAVAAVPAEGDDDWLFLSSGTWSLFGSELKKPIINDKVMDYNLTNEGGLEGKIRFLYNIMGLWLVQELRRAWTDRQGNAPAYGDLAAQAAEVKPWQRVVPPNWGPFYKMGQMPAKITAYCKATGQKPPKTQGEFVRTALDGLALAYRAAVDMISDLQGKRPSRLHIIGGGTQNLLLNQLAADACGIDVYAGPIEATAIGNIIAQMLADGVIATQAEGRAIVRESFELNHYKPRTGAAVEQAYGLYQELATRDVPYAG